MKLKNMKTFEEKTSELNISDVSGSISEIAMNWWYDLSDYKTDELIMKHNMRKPIKEDKILEVYNIEVGD
jgi:hypothetical protein